MIVICGLGNPGKEYKKTKHNVGFEVIDQLSRRFGIDVAKSRFRALFGEGHIGGEKVMLVKPMTFMNASGEALLDIMRYYKLHPEDFIVICDDKDIPFGRVRIKNKGSAGSHNGLKSIIYQLQSEDFIRIKVAIGKPEPPMALRDYVLMPFDEKQRQVVDEEIELAGEAVERIMTEGLEAAMNKIHACDKNILDQG